MLIVFTAIEKYKLILTWMQIDISFNKVISHSTIGQGYQVKVDG